MRGFFTLSGLVVVLGVGYFVYNRSLTSADGTVMPPQQQIDVVDIKANLLTIGQAERVYLAANGSYGTIEQLQQQGPPSIPTENRGYVFAIAANGAQSFRVTATPTDPGKAGWPTLQIDETMTVTER